MSDATTTRPPEAPPQPSFQQQLKDLWRDLPGLVSDRVELLSLELQRAARALVEIVAWLVALAVLGVTVWLALWAAIVGALVSAGLALPVALLAAIAVNVAVMALALQRVRRLLPRLSLAATRRHLTAADSRDLMPSPPPDAGTQAAAAAR